MQMLDPIWKGILTGLLFTLTFGTVFFSLIQTSVKRGFYKALFIALGVLLSDALFIAITVWGTSFVADEIKKFDMEIRIVGFAFLVILGIRSIIKKEVDHTNDAAPIERKSILYFIKGAMLNSLNPMVLISWMGVTTYVETVVKFDQNNTIFFFMVVLATMLTTMVGIVYFAGKLRHVLSAKNMHRLNVFSGIIFLVFALVIIWPVTGLGNF
jgi:threonine/homoserine/homoserine lactone efflux protein